MRFLHVADIHLDAQPRGLLARDDAPVEKFQRATRDAFENVISLALQTQVDFVVIAGDLFDRGWADTRTWLWAVLQLKRLEEAKIPVYLIRGNHDALGEGSQRVTWPANVHEFPSGQPGTHFIEPLRVALHGQSFGARAVANDLAASYPDEVPGYFNIGLLHTSLTSNPQHETYAPTSPDVLRSKRYDYWALGHVHTYQQVLDEPVILFPGCTQGRHINEPGEKGCVIVTVTESRVREIEFHATDTVRWLDLAVELTADDDREQFQARVAETFQQARTSAAGRPVAARLTVRGSTPCHHWLTSEAGLDEATSECAVVSRDLGDFWLSRLEVRTRPPVDVDQLRAGHDLLGEMLRDLQQFQNISPEELSEVSQEALGAMQKFAGAELARAGLDLMNPDVIRTWLDQAEGVIVDALATTEEQA